MKRLIISLIFLFTGCSAYPQVEKRIVVEHFSNTQCPICFGKNPGLYQNLDHFPRIIHLSIFPGSPYPNCFLHLQNPLASDGRTNYYGVYGSTPRLVIQGDPQSFSVDFNDPSIFAPYEDQTSPFSMKISVGYRGMDSLMASFMIKAVATTTLTQAKLFLAIAEDTVFYDAPNGEQQFYDVFRKAFTSYEGNLVQLPVVGDSITIDFVGPVNSEWNMDRLEVIGILQDQDTRKVIQAAITPDTEDYSSVPHLHYPKLSRIIMSPNPAGDFLILEKISGLVEIFSMNGKCLASYELGDSSKETRVDISNIPGGNYIVRNGSTSSNLVIVR